MNDEKRRPGRPSTKHLQDDHHFKVAEEQESVAVAENPINVQSVEKEIGAPNAFLESLDTTQQNVTFAEPSGQILELNSNDESAVEQQRVYLGENRIQNIEFSVIALNGWHPLDTEVVTETPPRNGIPVKVSESTEGDGIVVFWKRLRAFANATKRWQECGAWIDFHTGMKIAFEPKYWKERF
jgi:hypothetical protein